MRDDRDAPHCGGWKPADGVYSFVYDMNIIIPVGGIGKRFEDEGYRKPKPLINALGKPILLWNLEHLRIGVEDTVYIVYRAEFARHRFERLITGRFPGVDLRFVPLANDTRGAAETVLYALNEMPEDQLERQTIVIDSDNCYPDDVVGMAKNTGGNLVFYKKDREERPIYSYIRIEDDRVVAIREKVRISDNACVGAYCFESARVLGDAARSVISGGERQMNEYFISTLYDHLIRCGITVRACEIDDFRCLGTPHQVRSFSSNIRNSGETYSFCFSLFGTLVEGPNLPGDLETVVPLEPTVNHLNFLHRLGHRIIIHTSGIPGRASGAEREEEQAVRAMLRRLGIAFDELVFGKPKADFHIDSKSVSPSDDLEQETGFYNAHPPERAHHRIEIHEHFIVKHADSIEGERHYYRNIPAELRGWFPELLDSGDRWIKLSKVTGVPLSFLNVSGTLTADILGKLLTVLDTLHSWPTRQVGCIYANYGHKLRERMRNYDYSRFPDFGETSAGILRHIEIYEKEDRGVPGMIHGDPVLTNVLLDAGDNIRMIDMRGRLGDVLSLTGDVFYDYAKIYQSLAGYDFILMGRPLDMELVKRGKRVFEDHVLARFGPERLEDIRRITQSLLLSLIPLHNDHKCRAYYDLIHTL